MRSTFQTIQLACFLVVITLLVASCAPGGEKKDLENEEKRAYADLPLYKNPDEPIDTRAGDLLSQMTLEEKISQMTHESAAIPRLGIPAYDWWSEALHGVARAGEATVFPQAIGLGATFDEDLIFRVATAISDEARAMHHAAVEKGNRIRYSGLTFWSPNINIFRDPRWGRGQETYGEDPFLTSSLGLAFVKGLQGDDPDYLKVAACAKHFAVHSGPEALRHEFNALSSKKDLYETYLPAFKALVENGVEAVMCAYNRTNDEPCCGSKTLLGDILRNDWNFEGHVLSDCWALVDFHENHKVTNSAAESAAMALNHSVDLNCGNTYPYLKQAIDQGLVSEEKINQSVLRLLKTRIRLGMFDPPGLNPYESIPTGVINSEKHRALAYDAAVKSVVLLKNGNDILPLKKEPGIIFVTGPNAATIDPLIGNYYGLNRNLVTFLEGVAGKMTPGNSIRYKPGVLLDRKNVNPVDWATGIASEADVTIAVMGLSALLEGEEGESIASPYKGDRLDIGLPQNQVDYLKGLKKDNDKPLIVVLTGGSPMAIQEVHEIADAILFAWYPGQEGGNAVADIIFGDAEPSGRLPITFPKSLDDLPPYEDYSMQGRTYRYMEKEPLYPFGFGLSYTTFQYGELQLSANSISEGDSVTVNVDVTNKGGREAEEVVQLYMSMPDAPVTVPIMELKAFKRVGLAPGQTRKVSFDLSPEKFTYIDNEGRTNPVKGGVKIIVGGASPGQRSLDLGSSFFSEAVVLLK